MVCPRSHSWEVAPKLFSVIDILIEDSLKFGDHQSSIQCQVALKARRVSLTQWADREAGMEGLSISPNPLILVDQSLGS